MIAKNALDLIGNTPLVKINSFSQNATILAKAEFLNPSGSIKDRASIFMIKDAFEKGIITKDSVIIEPTSGNTGIGLAMVCAVYGLRLILTMPSSMSVERQKLIKAYGADIILTDPALGMKGAVDESLRLRDELKGFIPSQFDNSSNIKAHKTTTAKEILAEVTPDIFVAGFGSGGTISGVGEILKDKNPNIKIIAVEPASSPLLSKGIAGAHKIQGIGANFIPKNLNKSVVDEYFTVSNEDAFDFAKRLAKKEGLLVGISSGANVYAASKIANKPENRGKTIVTMLCDTGERYLSLFE